MPRDGLDLSFLLYFDDLPKLYNSMALGDHRDVKEVRLYALVPPSSFHSGARPSLLATRCLPPYLLKKSDIIGIVIIYSVPSVPQQKDFNYFEFERSPVNFVPANAKSLQICITFFRTIDCRSFRGVHELFILNGFLNKQVAY